MSSSTERLNYGKRKSQLARLVVSRIRSLHANASIGDSTSKGQLAVLRRSIFTPYAMEPQVWTVTRVPDELMPPNSGDSSTIEESVMHASMCIFARHQQSKTDLMHVEGVSFASAARELAFVQGSESEGVRRRLNAAATAVSFEEFLRHVASLVSMMRAKSIKFDYYKLVNDLYDYNYDFGRERVRRAWSRDYVSSRIDEKQLEK